MKRQVLPTLAFLLFLPAGCLEPTLPKGGTEPLGKADATDGLVPTIASINHPETVDVGVWNLEWYGDEQRGPTDLVQQDNVISILDALQFDLLGLVEVVSEESFAAMLEALPGYEGLLVTDPSVSLGSDYYWSREQKVGLLFRERFEISSARVILTENSWDFAGRPPLEVKLRFREAGKRRTLVVIVAHFKAMASADGYQRRRAAAAALEHYLSEEYPTRWVMVVGDFNDDIDTSTYQGEASPFASLADSADYRFATDALSEDGISTTTHYPSTIDHHLITNDLAERFVEGSARVLRVDEIVDNYDQTTSDHYPVLTRYDLR